MKNFKEGDKVKCVDASSHSYLKFGEIYTITKYSLVCDNEVFVKNEKGLESGSYYQCRFAHIKPKQTIEEQLKYAKSLVGRTVKYNISKPSKSNASITVESYNIIISGVSSGCVDSVVERDGYCVYISSGVFSIPIECVTKIMPDYKELKLNDQYTANVYKDKVEVGCQTFTINQVKEILKLSEDL